MRTASFSCVVGHASVAIAFLLPVRYSKVPNMDDRDSEFGLDGSLYEDDDLPHIQPDRHNEIDARTADLTSGRSINHGAGLA